MTVPTESRVTVNGTELALFEWPGEGTPILLIHATGFHARCWDQVVANLPGRHVYALDMRGHGRSQKLPPPYPWSRFAEDVVAVAKLLVLENIIGVGHSMGGHSVALAAGNAPGLFGSLLLVDPVIQDHERYIDPPPATGEHYAARRRNTWASPQEMFESFAKRPPFSGWNPDVLRDYCEHGLLPNPDGEGFVLACPPSVEGATYQGSLDIDPYPVIARINVPVRILRARPRDPGAPMDMSRSPTPVDLATHIPGAVDIPLPQYSHFIPMEDPALIARYILEG
jgi:pimeloyl-ACP methyl ester carboxylesterase